MSECEDNGWGKPPRQPQLLDAVMGFSSSVWRELQHNRCPGPSTVTCQRELWSSESSTGLVDHPARQHVWRVGRQVVEGPKGQTKSTKCTDILEENLTQTERRTSLCWRDWAEHRTPRDLFERKQLSECGIQSLDLILMDNLRIDLKTHVQR